MTFANLHLHTDGSLLDGFSRVDEVAQFAASHDQPAVAITDHGYLFNAPKFYEACTSRGVNPILGVEAYQAHGTIADRGEEERHPYHLILLAENSAGWQNIVELCTTAATDGFYGKPRVDMALLDKHRDGVICLSACLGGELAQTILNTEGDNFYAVRSVVERFKDVFGDRYYIEMQDHGQDDDARVNAELLYWAAQYDIPLVATQDSHYTTREDADVHDTLLCVQTLRRKSEPPKSDDNPRGRFAFTGPDYFLATYDHMRTLNLPLEAITNTVHLAARCHVELDLNAEPLIPQYALNAAAKLRARCLAALTKKYRHNYDEAKARLDYELDVIATHGFEDYFLIVADIVRFAHNDGVFVGPGRGSVGGSIVAYLLGITQIDPLLYGLLFERFLTAERRKMPDIDLDFDDEGRTRVLRYIADRFGEEKVAQVCTLGTFQEKAARQSIARALEIPAEDAQVSELVPRFVGVNKSLGRHAAGVAIAPKPLRGWIPLTRNTDTKGVGVMTQYQMEDLERFGVLKVDILGISRLRVMRDALKMINECPDEFYGDLTLSGIPLDDERVYAMLSAGDVHGTFQLDSYAGKKIIRKMRPACIDDIAVAVALDRPGPLDSGSADDYLARRAGKQKVSYFIPELEPILRDTYGVMVYQEQIMGIARHVAGYSVGESDLLREAVGKKLPEKMEAQRKHFVSGSVARGVDEAKADELFDQMALYSGYAFNKSHAVAYAIVAYQTAWLKYHFPVEFFCALANERYDVRDKLLETEAAARRRGLQILRPDVYASEDYHKIELGMNGKPAIRPGLLSIKDFGATAYVSLRDGIAKAGGRFDNLEHMLRSCNLQKLNAKSLTALTRAGAMLDFGSPTKVQTEAADTLVKLRKEREKAAREWLKKQKQDAKVAA